MAKQPKLIIAGKVFFFLSEAEREARRILNDGPVGSVICGADSEFVEHLWQNRPDKHAEFPGKKVVRFERRWREGKEKWTRCFWAVFENGHAVDFSFGKALKNIVAAPHPTE